MAGWCPVSSGGVAKGAHALLLARVLAHQNAASIVARAKWRRRVALRASTRREMS